MGKIVQITLEGIADEVVVGKTVELRNFGVFEAIVRKSRIGHNPNQPEKTVVIPDRAVIKFKAAIEAAWYKNSIEFKMSGVLLFS